MITYIRLLYLHISGIYDGDIKEIQYKHNFFNEPQQSERNLFKEKKQTRTNKKEEYIWTNTPQFKTKWHKARYIREKQTATGG